MTTPGEVRRVLDAWKARGWTDHAGAALTVSDALAAGSTPPEAARLVDEEFLARNGATRAAVGSAIGALRAVVPTTAEHREARVLVLTALQVEYNAVVSRVPEIGTVRTSTGTRYSVGSVEGQHLTWSTHTAEIDAGNYGAVAEVTVAAKEFDSDLVMFVGVAGGLKAGLTHGDVVVPTRVHLYHGGKDADEFRARPRSYETSHRLTQVATVLRREWGVPVHLKPIAAGEVVVGSSASDTAAVIRDHYNDAVAVDMESGGVHLAAARVEVPVLVVRGISDMLDDKTAQDDLTRQPVAAANAASFAVHLLRNIDSTDLGRKEGGR